jgi:hypothetical protein
MSIKQWLRNWLMSDNAVLAKETIAGNRVSEEDALLTFNIIRATNGYIVKVSQYKPQQRGPDWRHELYIVKDDEKIPDVIARIMAIKSLEQ